MSGAKKTPKIQATRPQKKPNTARSKSVTTTVVKKKIEAAVAPDPRPARRLKPRRYKSLRLTKRIKHQVKLPSAWKIAKQAQVLILKNWKIIGGIILVYGLLNMVLVRGLSGGLDVRQLKQEFNQLSSSAFGHLASGLSIFALLVGSTTTTSGANGATTYQSLLVIVVSLALVWAYRQILAEQKIRIRDAYYKGMYPIIPVILVLLVVSLQLVPMLIGGWVYGLVIQNGIAITFLDKFLWGGLFFLLSLLSLYMVTSSIFALYIVTLADMTPMKALRSARNLVRYRRWTVMRKVLFLPVWLLVIGSLFMLPFILLIPVTAQWVFFVVTMLAIAVIQSYMYTLYRELLREKTAS